METNDFYFLVMVLGAFGAFALAMIIATVQYKTWLKRTPQPVAVPANRNQPPLKRAA
jgi:hypothetical protein